MSIRAVFLDLDGTTVDTEARNRRAIEQESSKAGYDIKPTDWEFLAGQGDGIIWQKIALIKPEIMTTFGDAASFEAACLRAKFERICEVKKIDETGEAIKLFRENKLDIVAAVSNSTGPEAKASLKQAGYSTSDFDFCLFRDDIERLGLRAKPFPDPYIEAMRMANERLKAKAEAAGETFVPLTPEECLVLEDSRTGVRSGLAARMNVIQMTDETPALESADAAQCLKDGGHYFPVRRTGLIDQCHTLLAHTLAPA